MVKSTDEVIKDFNEVVNMTAEEIEVFLKTEASESTGFKKDDGSGESIGHESGRKIVDILKRNPDKVGSLTFSQNTADRQDPSKYTEEDQEHMRKVVSYCKRHLAQESHLKDEKTDEELEKMKSTRSLKNWGHDPLKSTASANGGTNKPKSSGKPASKKGGKKAEEKEETSEKPKSKSSAKPTSKKAAASKATDDKEEEVEEAPAEKPKSKTAAKPTSKKAAAAAAEDKTEDAEAGEKRAAEKPPKADKPASKKAKTEKPVTEGSRKPPSRSVKKA